MPSYRFCRPDDIGLLVEAVNSCVVIHQPGEDTWTVPRYRGEMRRIGLWPSSCMLAFGDDGCTPVAVCLGCKGSDATLIYRLGVSPEHQRRGHGTHLLDSLSRKLAVLGPPRLTVELDEQQSDLARFFEARGYLQEARYADYRCEARTESPAGREHIGPIGVRDAEEAGLLPIVPRAWERSAAMLLLQEKSLKGLAFASIDRLEACVLYRETETAIEVLHLGAQDTASAAVLYELLLRHLIAEVERPLVIPKARPDELPETLRLRLGLIEQKAYCSYTAFARAG